MKKLLIAFSLLLAMSFTTKSAQAQTTDPDVNLILGNLLAVNISDIQLDITTGDITLVNVNDVLNRSEIRILTDFLNNNTVTIDDVLTNLLRDADILNKNQVVVGILSSGAIVFTTLTGKK